TVARAVFGGRRASLSGYSIFPSLGGLDVQIFRKHKRGLLIIMFLLIGVPMLFFGVPAFQGGGQNVPGMAVVASVGGVPVMESDFMGRLNQIAQQQAASGGE